jgi:hypothetical protein
MIQTYIEKIRKEAATLLDKAERLTKLTDRFPDLERTENRWRHEKLCSKEVNAIADKCYIHHNCGCCSDSPVEVEPYIEIEGFTIHSKPYSVMVGEKDPYEYGDRRWENWRESLEKAGFSEKIINQVDKHFKKEE